MDIAYKNETSGIPYISDGLVTMFDGKWNAGVGVHQAAPLCVKNLVSHMPDLAIDSGMSFEEDFIRFDCNNTSLSFCSFNPGLVKWTFEFVAHLENSQTRDTRHIGVDTAYGVGCLGTWCRPPTYCFRNGNIEKTIANYSQGKADIDIALTYDDNDTICHGYVNGNKMFKQAKINYDYAGVMTTLFMSRDGNKNPVTYLKSLRVYDRKLTDEEIMFNYEVDKQRFGI